MQTPLKRVKGLGAAAKGTGHWLAQRVTAIALTFLLVWFVASSVALIGADYGTIRAWIGDPIVAVFLTALVIALFYHLKLGLEVILEDYVHSKTAKIASLLVVSGGCWVFGLLGVLSILKISLGS